LKFARIQYIYEILNSCCKNDSRALFYNVRKLSGDSNMLILPSFSYHVDLANKFAQFFQDKILDIILRFKSEIQQLGILNLPTHKEENVDPK